MISHNRGQMTKTCGPTSARATRSRSASSTTSTPRRGSSSGEIERLVDEGVSRAEIAIFYRTNAQSRVLEDTLVRREIGYQVIGGTKFYERAEIKDAIAYLTVLANRPGRRLVHARGQLAAARDRPDVALARARARGDDGHLGVGGRRRPGAGARPGHRRRARVRALHGDDDVAARAAEQQVPIGDLLEAILHETGYLEALEAERTIEAQGRIENLEELVEVAREFDAAPRSRATLDLFLQQVVARRRRRHAHATTRAS